MAGDRVAVQVPMVDVGNGLFIIIGGFIEVDSSDETAVEVTYVGGSKRKLSTEQSEKFLIAIGLKEKSRLLTSAPRGINTSR